MEIVALNLFFKKSFHVLCWLKPSFPVVLFMDIFWYLVARIQCVFLAAWESLAVWASAERTPEDSIPGIPLKISALQKYQYSFIPGSQTHNITYSKFPPPLLHICPWQLLSFSFTQGKKMIITHIDDQNIKAPMCKMIQEKWKKPSYVHFASH